VIDIGAMFARRKAEEEKVFAALRKAKNEQSALKVLRRFDVHPLMRRKVDIQAFAQARGWHSPEWADAPALGIQEPDEDDENRLTVLPDGSEQPRLTVEYTELAGQEITFTQEDLTPEWERNFAILSLAKWGIDGRPLAEWPNTPCGNGK